MNVKNMLRTVFIVPALILFAFIIAGCSTTKYTGRTQVMWVDENEKLKCGVRAWAEIRKREKESQNEQYKQAINRVGGNLAKVIKTSGYRWEFLVFDNARPNAFCLPGYKLGIYAGLFKYIRNNAELASKIYS